MATVSLKSTKGKWVMVSTILASAMAFIDSTALNVVLPSLQKSLNATGADLFWILNAYLLMLASFILLGGALGDRLGRKKVFMAGIAIFIAGSAACGFAPNVNLLIFFRLIQGFGGALMIPGSLSLISSSIDHKEKGQAIGTWSAFTTVVTMGGPILGGALADAGLWRFIFFINVPLGITVLLMLWLKVAETKDAGNSHKTPDFFGAIGIVGALAALTFGFLSIPSFGISHPKVYVSLAVGLLLLLLFLYGERKSAAPMMPLKLFSNSTFSGANLLTFFLYAGLSGSMLFLSLNLVQVQGYSQLQSGLTFLPFTLLMIAIARFAGKLADHHGPRLFLVFGPAIAGVGLLLLSLVKQTNGPQEYWTSFFPGVLILGLGMSFTVAPLTTAVMNAVADQFSGTASGVNNAITRIASVFAIAIFGALAILVFSDSVTKQLAKIPLQEKQKTEVMRESMNLGDARAPSDLNAQTKSLINKAYHLAFIDAYIVILRICATLAFMSSLMAVMFINDKSQDN